MRAQARLDGGGVDQALEAARCTRCGVTQREGGGLVDQGVRVQRAVQTNDMNGKPVARVDGFFALDLDDRQWGVAACN